jgi:ParB family chromosome partitioning protein
VQPNPDQPRHQIDAGELESLASSIARHGVLQPIVVAETLDGYQLIAGERRWRAAQLAGLERIPAIVRSDPETHERLELALVENLQRSDLNALDEAAAFRRLIDEFGLTQEEVAARVARARSSVANTLRLLDLAPGVQTALADGRLTEGHARAIGALTDAEAQERLAEIVVARGLSVRETEQLARQRKTLPIGDASVAEPARDPDVERLEGELRAALGTKVTLTPGRRGGRIVIRYYDGDDLGRLSDRLLGGAS